MHEHFVDPARAASPAPAWPRRFSAAALAAGYTGARADVRPDTATQVTCLAQVERQVAHWVCAARRLSLADLGSREAWDHLEQYLGLAVRELVGDRVDRLQADADALEAALRSAYSRLTRLEAQRRLIALRHQYERTEGTLGVFADALSTRARPRMGALLRACDSLAQRSMAQLLEPLGLATPVALCYLDRGPGAPTAQLSRRLWDGTRACPVAAIKVNHHNLLRPTALIHEAGHHVAHLTRWSEELGLALLQGLQQQAGATAELAALWKSWSTEIAADAFAFAHTGFASVAALHDTLSGHLPNVFRHTPGDPHPIAYLRVLLGVACCRYFHGAGPWDALERAWTEAHRAELAPSDLRRIAQASQPLLNTVVRLTLDTPMQSFNGRALRALIDPERSGPAALARLAEEVGPLTFATHHWRWTDPLRVLGLAGLQIAERPRNLKKLLEQQENALLRLGNGLQSAPDE